MDTDAGPAVADLRVCPWHKLWAEPGGTGYQMGSRHFEPDEYPPPSHKWSELAADVPAGGIPTRLIRAINIGQLLELAQERAAAESEYQAGVAGRLSKKCPESAEFARRLADHSEAITGPRKRPGKRGNGIEHYLRWAVRYDEKVRAGVRFPIKALADEHRLTVRYVRDTITDARRRYHLLTKPGQGHAGGQLTDDALKILADMAKREEATPEKRKGRKPTARKVGSL